MPWYLLLLLIVASPVITLFLLSVFMFALFLFGIVVGIYDQIKARLS